MAEIALMRHRQSFFKDKTLPYTYSGTSDKGPSEIGTTSLQRTLVRHHANTLVYYFTSEIRLLSIVQRFSLLQNVWTKYRQVVNSLSIVGRLSTLQSVHYQRFHCIQLKMTDRIKDVYTVEPSGDMCVPF